MARSSKRLGRGLDSLVSSFRPDVPPEREKSAAASHQQIARYEPLETARQTSSAPISKLQSNPFQPRRSISTSDVNDLAQSIRRSGLLQPIAVRRLGESFQIIAGERRWLAAKVAGLSEVPIVVREASDEQMLELALIENLQREDLNAIDRAKGYAVLCERFDLRPEEVASRLAEDRTTVVNYLRLLDLSDDIQGMVADGRLSMGHARCLLGVPDPSRRRQLADSAARSGLSVRGLEEVVRREKTPAVDRSTDSQREPHRENAHLADLKRRFEEALSTKVMLHEGKRKGTGRIVIEFFSFDDFDRIAGKLGVSLE